MDFGPEPELSTPPVMEAVVREHSLIPQYVTIPSAGVIVRFRSLKDPSVDLQSWVLPKQPDTPFRVNYLRAVPLTEEVPVVEPETEATIALELPEIEATPAIEKTPAIGETLAIGETPEPEQMPVIVEVEEPVGESAAEPQLPITEPQLPITEPEMLVTGPEILAAEPEIWVEEIETPIVEPEILVEEIEILLPETDEPAAVVSEPEANEPAPPERQATPEQQATTERLTVPKQQAPPEQPEAKLTAPAAGDVAPTTQPESPHVIKPFPQFVNGSLFGDMETPAPDAAATEETPTEETPTEPTPIKSLIPPVQIEEEEEEISLEQALTTDPIIEAPIAEEPTVGYTGEAEETQRIDKMAAPTYTEQLEEPAVEAPEAGAEVIEEPAEEIEEEEGWEGPEEEIEAEASEIEDESVSSVGIETVTSVEAETSATIDTVATQSAEAGTEEEDALLRRRTPSRPAAAKPAVPGKRGRKSLKQVAAEADLIEIPEDEVLFSKQYYTMGEVSEMFKVNQSLLRFWETEFDILQPRKNKKGDRYFRPLDIKNLHLIYHLLRQKKYTIEGAKEFLKKNKKAEERFEVIRRLQEIRTFLMDWKGML